MDDLLKLILRDLLEGLLFFLLLLLVLRLNHELARFSTALRAFLTTICGSNLLLAFALLELLLLHLLLLEHLLLHNLLLLLHSHLLLHVSFFIVVVTLSFVVIVVFLTILILLLLLHIIEVLRSLFIVFLNLPLIVTVVFDLLTPSHYLIVSLGGILQDHLLAFDVLHGLVLILLLLLLAHVVFNELFREGELVRVLFILLLEVLQQHGTIGLIKLIEIDKHLLIFVTFTLVSFLIVIIVILLMLLLHDAGLLLLGGLFVLLEFHQTL